MIAKEMLADLARRYQTSEFPNVVREYFQHIFLSSLSSLAGAEKMLFKGGTALRILYGSPRFSEDLDFSLVGVARNESETFIEAFSAHALAEMTRAGIDAEPGNPMSATSGGYYGDVICKMEGYPSVNIVINVSLRHSGKVRGEVDVVAGDFAPAYSVMHVPQQEIVEEKIFGALRERKKPRDFYDLYFMMRKGMLSSDQKKRCAKIQNEILTDAKKINFRAELGAFLPVGQQMVIRDFLSTLEREMHRQFATS